MKKHDGFNIPGNDNPEKRRKIFAGMIVATESHIDLFGGYVYDSNWFGDKFVVAALDDSKERHRTQLITYSKGDLLTLVDETIDDNGDGNDEKTWIEQTIKHARPY